MRYIVICLLTLSCGAPETTPWYTNPKNSELTAKHLARLNSSYSFTPFTIGLTGDTQAVVGHFRSVVEVTNDRPDLDFLVILGDLTDMGFQKEWDMIVDSIEQSNKPVLTVVGNHDGLAKGPLIYNKVFGPFNYSFHHNGVKFIMWNNNFHEWGHPDFDWLEYEVATHDRVVVMAHQPPGAGTLLPWHEKRWKMIRAYPSYSLSLHGHVHHYSHRYEASTDTQIYTVDRVTGTHFGTLSFNHGGVTLQNCKPKCEVSTP